MKVMKKINDMKLIENAKDMKIAEKIKTTKGKIIVISSVLLLLLIVLVDCGDTPTKEGSVNKTIANKTTRVKDGTVKAKESKIKLSPAFAKAIARVEKQSKDFKTERIAEEARKRKELSNLRAEKARQRKVLRALRAKAKASTPRVVDNGKAPVYISKSRRPAYVSTSQSHVFRTVKQTNKPIATNVKAKRLNTKINIEKIKKELKNKVLNAVSRYVYSIEIGLPLRFMDKKIDYEYLKKQNDDNSKRTIKHINEVMKIIPEPSIEKDKDGVLVKLDGIASFPYKPKNLTFYTIEVAQIGSNLSILKKMSEGKIKPVLMSSEIDNIKNKIPCMANVSKGEFETTKDYEVRLRKLQIKTFNSIKQLGVLDNIYYEDRGSNRDNLKFKFYPDNLVLVCLQTDIDWFFYNDYFKNIDDRIDDKSVLSFNVAGVIEQKASTGSSSASYGRRRDGQTIVGWRIKCSIAQAKQVKKNFGNTWGTEVIRLYKIFNINTKKWKIIKLAALSDKFKMKFDSLMATGNKAISKHKWEEAEKAFKQAMKISGYEDSKLAQQGMIAVRSNAEQMRKQQFDSLMATGNKAISKHKWEEAEKAFKQAMKISGYEDSKLAKEGIQNVKKSKAERVYKSTLSSIKKSYRESCLLDKKDIKAYEKYLKAFKMLINFINSSHYHYLDKNSKQHLTEFESQIENYYSRTFKMPDYTIPGLQMKLVYVAPGIFQMGSNNGGDNEKPVHNVTISKGYWIGKYEVTKKEYQFMGFKSRYIDSNKSVTNIAWNTAVKFCKKLTAREHAAGRLPSDCEYRLPTEAEWEFAARGGNKSRSYKYSGSDNIENVAVFHSKSPNKTRKPNEIGIYDMSGNVEEWCKDGYGKYSSDNVTDPTGLTSSYHRVIRGGCYVSDARHCRSTSRDYHKASYYYTSSLGFRVVRTVSKGKK